MKPDDFYFQIEDYSDHLSDAVIIAYDDFEDDHGSGLDVFVFCNGADVTYDIPKSELKRFEKEAANHYKIICDQAREL